MDSESEGRAQRQADLDGSESYQVVVGDRALVIRAEGSSVVTVPAGEPPRVERRVPPNAEPPHPGPVPLGRERELTTIIQALDAGLPVQVHGGDGSGRSTLLRHLAQIRGGDRDVVFLSACGLTIDDLLQTLFDACFDGDGYRPEPLQMRMLMQAVRALLIVDDFDGTTQDLKTLLDVAPACEIVVASRERTLWSGGLALELGGIAESAGIALLTRELGWNVEASGRADAAELWRAAGGKPLALVQASAAVRAEAGALADFRDAQQVTQALVLSRTEPQRQVLGILYLVGAVPAPVALLKVLIGSPCETAIERLVAAGLVTEGQPRIAGQLAERVAALVAPSVAPARLAEAITTWLATGPDRRLLGESAPLILQVLRATMAAGDHRTAIRLARTASPRLAAALHLGAWGTLLELGLSAARVVGAADDEAYFTHEATARLQTLSPVTLPVSPSQTADVTTTAASAPLVAAVAPHAVPERGSFRTVVARPAIWVLAIAVAIAGTIAFTALDTDDQPQAAPVGPTTTSTTSAPTVASTESTTAPASTTPVTTSVPTVTSASVSASASAPASPAATSTAGSTDNPTNPPPECAPFVAALDFAPTLVGGSETLRYSFQARSCHRYGLDTGNMTVVGDSAFSFSLVSCPEITTSDSTCTITISFCPAAPGDFNAQIYIPEAGPATEQRSYGSIQLYGHADEPAYEYDNAYPA